MKKMVISTLFVASLFAMAAPASASSDVYTVPKNGKITAGVYENGKLLIAAKNKKEILPITDVERVKSTIFYTEFSKSDPVYQCGGDITEYNLKMKQGKAAVTTLKDKISNLSSGISSDGTYLYYAAITSDYSNELVRLSADGKSRRVLAKNVDDVWYAQGQLYYLKNKSIYTMDPKKLKSTQLAVMKGKVFPQGPCSSSSHWATPNGIILEDSEDFGTSPTRYVYEYKTKKVHKVKVKPIGSGDHVSMVDIDLKNKRYVNLDFDGDQSKLYLGDYSGKKIKEVHKLSYLYDWVNSTTTSRYFEELDAVKREITYVSGTKRIVKKF